MSGLTVKPCCGLQIGEMTVADGEALERRAVELELRRRVDRAQPVLLVDRLAQHDRPAAVAALEEVVEAAGADDVALDAVDRLRAA